MVQARLVLLGEVEHRAGDAVALMVGVDADPVDLSGLAATQLAHDVVVVVPFQGADLLPVEVGGHAR